MKKTLAILLTVVMVASAFTFAFADGAFIESPSLSEEKTLEVVNDGGTGKQLVITPYRDKSELAQEKKEEIEDAYNAIANAEKLSDICPAITESNVAVSDLFDISFDGDAPEGEYEVTVKLTSEMVEDLLYLIHYNGQEFEIVEDVVKNGDEITFTLTDCSPFAIVVSAENPGTGDSNAIVWAAAIAGLCLCGIVVTTIVYKKKRV